MATCKICNRCCKHIAVEIDKPTCKTDYDNILWYLTHKNVKVWVSHDDEWHIEFNTVCDWLGEDGLCIRYDERPKMCRDYSPEDCICEGEEEAEKLSFTTYDEFKAHLESKNIDYKFKKQ